MEEEEKLGGHAMEELQQQSSHRKPDLQNVLEIGTPRQAFTVRRNPTRRARPQTSAVALFGGPTSVITSTVPIPFQIDDPPNLEKPLPVSENLKVFLRIRPLDVKGRPASRNGSESGRGEGRGKFTRPRKDEKKVTQKRSMDQEVCLVVNNANSVTLTTPASSLVDAKRTKCEVYDGFSYVFPPESRQREVYERVMSPLVKEFMEGKSGLLAAMGPSGSGKTHTMFGSPRDPGMLSLALQHLFRDDGIDAKIDSTCARSYYLSMFEICSTRGKQERIFDLSSNETDLSLPRSTIEGLHEVLVSSVVDAECIIARGMLRRATAKTYANDQSSRSQCIINICNYSRSTSPDSGKASSAVLTVVDLAGAERERGTSNQGSRLVESSFINNTSMVFGLCLRSLLEHQRNPKMVLQKHFQNSLLTKYLREYLEGKKRLTLILTAKPGENDYLDTSFLLRQASPYMKIKFTVAEELPSQKRPAVLKSRSQLAKRRKYCDPKVDEVNNGSSGPLETKKETEQSCEDTTCSQACISISNTIREDNTIASYNEEFPVTQRPTRNEEIMIRFSRTIWKALKDFKQKLKVSEDEVQRLKESFREKHTQVILLEQELKDLWSFSSEQFPLHGLSNPKKDMVSLAGSNLTMEQPNEDALKKVGGDYCESFTEAVSSMSKVSSFIVEDVEDTLSNEEIYLKSQNIEKSDLDLPSINTQQDAHLEDIFPKREIDFKVPDLTDDDAQEKPELKDILPMSGNQQDSLFSPSLSHVSGDRETGVSFLQRKLSKEGEKHFLKSEISSVTDIGNIDQFLMQTIPLKEITTVPGPPNGNKPKRKLLPASAMLLKEFAQLDLEGANAKEKQGRAEERHRSQGSIALVRLLRGNLPK